MILISVLRAIKYSRLCKCSDNSEIDLLGDDFLIFDPDLLNRMPPDNAEELPINTEASEKQAIEQNENNEPINPNTLDEEEDDFFEWLEKNKEAFTDAEVQEVATSGSAACDKNSVPNTHTFSQNNLISKLKMPESSEQMVENLPPPKRAKTVSDFFYENASADFASNFSYLPTNNFEIQENSSTIFENQSAARLESVKQQQIVNQMIISINRLFERVMFFNSMLKTYKKFFDFLVYFIKEKSNLACSSSSPNNITPERISEILNFFKVENQKFSTKKPIEELSKDLISFAIDMKEYTFEFSKVRMPIEVLIKCCETLESYLKAMLKFENILVSDKSLASKYLRNEYQTKTYKLDKNVAENSKTFGACQNSEYIYVINGNDTHSKKCDIIRICIKEGLEQVKTFSGYNSKNTKQFNRFSRCFKRILTDSENRVYALNMDNVTVIQIFSNEFEEIGSITVEMIEFDSGIKNIFMSDFCLRENKLYILDTVNLFIYCYDLDLKFSNKIKINDNFLKSLEACLSVSQNYIFITYKFTLLTLDLNSYSLNKFDDFLTSKTSNILILNDQSFITKCKKQFFLYPFDISNDKKDIVIEEDKSIKVRINEVEAAIISEIVSHCDNEITLISLNTDEAIITKVILQ